VRPRLAIASYGLVAFPEEINVAEEEHAWGEQAFLVYPAALEERERVGL
jgi:hypothetical protein